MYIKSIDLENYRNYNHIHIDLEKGVNIFYGENAYQFDILFHFSQIEV